MSICGVSAETTFINPIEDGEVVRDFDAETGYKRIAISNDDIKNAEVLVSCDGKVKNIDKRLNGTYDVTITHEDGYITMYIDMGKVNFEVGSEVKQGDVIGKSGENVYEADLKNHLHFILQKGDQLYNPEKFIGQTLDMIK